ncbi:MAG TPA: GNAT family N-acetyltransferase [Terriglobales bacterium]|nr:GNAT family N-acetyltransferase [Terriglobales bacterium]
MAISITVRRATAQDAESVATCLESAFEPFRSQYTREAFEDTVLSPQAVRARMQQMTIYVAGIADFKIVGTIAAAMEGEEGHLRGMAVLPAWQGHSIAKHLLHVAEHDLATAGCVRLTLNTTMPLQRAIRFYERNGFIPSGRITDFFGMPLHEYTKPLSLHPPADSD